MIDVEDMGMQIHEAVIKKGLRELNSDLHFDMGAKLDLVHPMMNLRQGVFYKGQHLCTMDRGMIPEFQVQALEKRWDREAKKIVKDVPGLVLRVGWRHTFERLIQKNIPGVTRESLAKKFNTPIKFFVGDKPDKMLVGA